MKKSLMKKNSFNGLVPTILIIDDIKANILFLKTILESENEYRFLEAYNGKDGIELAKKELPHIILIDAVMPVMDGFEAIKILRNDEATKKIPILMISSLTNADDKVKFLQSGSSDFISKPYDPVELITRVNSLLTLHIQFLQKEQELKDLYEYDRQQQLIAKEKLEVGIVNDLTSKEAKVVYHPFDILSGDYYSIYKFEDGSIFAYILDGQGHGVAPALTVFSVSARIKTCLQTTRDIEVIASSLFPNIKNYLGEVEQLSYTFVTISADRKKISYLSAGMYPMYVKTEKEIFALKANNLPFMEFSPNPTIKYIDLEDTFESLILYSDGFVECENKKFSHITPQAVLQKPSLLDTFIEKIDEFGIEDDVTIIHLQEV